MNYIQAIKKFNKNIRIYILIEFLIGFSVFGGITNAIQNIFIARLGYDTDFMGIIMGSALFVILIFSPFAAKLGSNIGLGKTLMLGILVATIGLGLMPFGGFISPAYRKIWILGFNCFSGIGIPFYLVNINPFIMRNTTTLERTHVYSVRSAMTPIGGFFGSLVAGFAPGFLATLLNLSLNDFQPYLFTMLISPLILVIGVFLLLKVDDSINLYHQKEREKKSSSPVPIFLIFTTSLILFFQVTGEVGARNFINVYLDEVIRLTTSKIGLILAIGNLITIPAALLTPIIETNIGHRKTFWIFSLLISLFIICLVLFHHWLLASLSFFLIISAGRISKISYFVYTLEQVDHNHHPTLSASQTLASTIGAAVTVLAGGFIIKHQGYTTMFLIVSGLTFIGTSIFFMFFRMRKNKRHL